MHTWSYLKDGWFDTQIIGPISDIELRNLLYDGLLTLQTQVMSQTLTQGTWVHVYQMPQYVEIVEQGQRDRDEQRKQDRENQRVQRQIAAKESAERMRQLEFQREQAKIEEEEQESRKRELMEARGRQMPAAAPPAHRYPEARPVSNLSSGTPEFIVHEGVVYTPGNINITQQVFVASATSVAVHSYDRSSNRGAAILLNLFLMPGLGQFLQNKPGRGTLILISWWTSIALMFFCVGFFTAPMVWLYALIDAAVD